LGTGLACALLGTCSPGELDTHPLRGAIFENLGAVEALKRELNRGIRPRWFFWRDQRGLEIDLLEPEPTGRAIGLECKSAQTWSDDWDVTLGRVTGQMVRANRALRTAIVYGGSSFVPGRGKRPGADLVPCNDVGDWLDTAPAP